MLSRERRAALDACLTEAATFDVIFFRRVYTPPQPCAARGLILRIGAPMPQQWQGVVRVGTNDEAHMRLRELLELWPCHYNVFA